MLICNLSSTNYVNQEFMLKYFVTDLSTMKKIGQITHFFDKIGVAVLSIEEGSVKLGDQLQIGEEKGENTFTQTVESMQVDHQPVEIAEAGSEVGLKLTNPTKPNTPVFLVE